MSNIAVNKCIRYKDFLVYKAELDSISDPDAKSKRAIAILVQEQLPTEIDLARIVFKHKNGYSAADARYFYIFNCTIPYYGGHIVPFHVRNCYWITTSSAEDFLQKRIIYVRGEYAKLNFKHDSGDHYKLSAGYGSNVADFSIYLKNAVYHNVDVEFKFSSKKYFKTIEDVCVYYDPEAERNKTKSNHLHYSKIMLVFLEEEKCFYTIDFEYKEILRQNLPELPYYVSSDEISELVEPSFIDYEVSDN